MNIECPIISLKKKRKSHPWEKDLMRTQCLLGKNVMDLSGSGYQLKKRKSFDTSCIYNVSVSTVNEAFNKTSEEEELFLRFGEEKRRRQKISQEKQQSIREIKFGKTLQWISPTKNEKSILFESNSR